MNTSSVDEKLQPLLLSELPTNHPVGVLARIFEKVQRDLFGEQLPAWEAIDSRAPSSILDCALIMVPVERDGYIDYEIIKRGGRMPSVDPDDVASWKYYSDSVSAESLMERLLELTSCTVLKQHRISSALSARSSSLNIKVYRGIFPVYFTSRKLAGVILSVAPPYAEVASDVEQQIGAYPFA